MDMMPLNPNPTQWSDRLAFEVALALEGSGESSAEICQKHGLSRENLRKFQRDSTFLRAVANYRDEITEKGLTFRVKARAQAEELLQTSWFMIHDTTVSPAVRADLIKSTVRWAGLEVKNDESSGGAAGGVRININLGGGPLTVGAGNDVIEHSG